MEVCVDNLESAINAEKGGAMRIELCSSLSEGGLTPTPGFLKIVKDKLSIPIFVMIRPRGGNFVYSEDELEIMKHDIIILKENGADGFVFGIINYNGKVDIKNCSTLLKHTGGLPSTFHRAFDQVAAPLEALEDIIALGFQRILTSGLQPNALMGSSLIKELIEASRNRIIIMPGAGINKDNVSKILAETGAKEFHGSAKTMKGTYSVTNEDYVKEMLTIYYSNSESPSEYSPKPRDHTSPEENQ